MVGLIKKIFIGLLSVFTVRLFIDSLVSNSKAPIKYGTLTNQPCQIGWTMSGVNKTSFSV